MDELPFDDDARLEFGSELESTHWHGGSFRLRATKALGPFFEAHALDARLRHRATG